jgi:hypothetical protein
MHTSPKNRTIGPRSSTVCVCYAPIFMQGFVVADEGKCVVDEEEFKVAEDLRLHDLQEKKLGKLLHASDIMCSKVAPEQLGEVIVDM